MPVVGAYDNIIQGLERKRPGGTILRVNSPPLSRVAMVRFSSVGFECGTKLLEQSQLLV